MRFISKVLIFTIIYMLIRSTIIFVYSPRDNRIKSVQIKHWIKPNLVKKSDEYACHYFKGNSALPVVDRKLKFPLNSIFFIEASCMELSSRQACSVESAARANPDRQINVLFTTLVSWDKFNNSTVKILLTIANVRAARIHLEDYARGTPLHIKFKKRLSPEDLNMELTDILKYLTIYKYSGTYLALDLIVARSFRNLTENWVVKETSALMSSDMFSFSNNYNGRALADMALDVLLNDLAIIEGIYSWRFDGASVMGKLMRTWCGVRDIMFLVSSKCQELTVGSPRHFVPIPFYKRRLYFKAEDAKMWRDKDIFTYQVWDRLSAPKGSVHKNSLYGQLAKKYCPMIYKLYGDKFGI